MVAEKGANTAFLLAGGLEGRPRAFPEHTPHPRLGPSGPSTPPVSPHDPAGLSLKHRTPPSAAWILRGSAHLAPTARPELESRGGATQSLSTQSPLRVDPASPACRSHLGPRRLGGGRWTVPVGQLVNNARSTGLREVLRLHLGCSPFLTSAFSSPFPGAFGRAPEPSRCFCLQKDWLPWRGEAAQASPRGLEVTGRGLSLRTGLA